MLFHRSSDTAIIEPPRLLNRDFNFATSQVVWDTVDSNHVPEREQLHMALPRSYVEFRTSAPDGSLAFHDAATWCGLLTKAVLFQAV